jgi:hypothetical protein
LISSLPSGTNPIAKTGASSLVFRDSAISSLLSIGEELNISVAQRQSARQYLVALKDRMILADSATSLRVGDELRVRVEQRHPQLVLRILSGNAAARDILTENLRFFRANPEGFLGSLARTEDLLAQAIVHPRLSPSLLKDIRAIQMLIGALRYSGTTMDNRNYLRDYPIDLGLLLESHLNKVVLEKGERGLQNGRVSGGLKELLLQLTGRLRVSQTDDTLPPELRLTLQQVQSSAEKTVETIENQQVINVMLQEIEHSYMLQIPLLFPGGMKLGDILIREDEHTDRAAGEPRSFTVELFFDLDLLGHVLIELRLKDKQIGCICKCEDAVVRDFIASRLSGLQERLFTAGYRVERLACILEHDLERKRLALQGNYQLYSADSVNLFV